MFELSLFDAKFEHLYDANKKKKKKEKLIAKLFDLKFVRHFNWTNEHQFEMPTNSWNSFLLVAYM